MSLRGAVSIARRLQDPLAELVKIDPKSIGVGQYQHDIASGAVAVARRGRRGLRQRGRRRRQHRLGAAADAGCRASARALADEHRRAPRRARRRSARRTALKDVPRLGPKAFEQCAGFLRIRGGDDPLDASGVHPEAYPVVRRIVADDRADVRGADRQQRRCCGR